MIPTTVAAIAGISHVTQELWEEKKDNGYIFCARAIYTDKTSEKDKYKIKL